MRMAWGHTPRQLRAWTPTEVASLQTGQLRLLLLGPAAGAGAAARLLPQRRLEQRAGIEFRAGLGQKGLSDVWVTAVCASVVLLCVRQAVLLRMWFWRALQCLLRRKLQTSGLMH